MSGSRTAITTPLSQHRALLLALECIGWVHMTGKAHPDFLRSQSGLGSGYRQKDWPKDLPDDWEAYWGWVTAPSGFQLPGGWRCFLKDFDERRSKASAVGLLQAAHAMASGIEKNLPNKPSEYLGQDASHLWLGSAFGHPQCNLLAHPPALLQEGGWDELLRRIGALLSELERLGRGPGTSCEDWHWWREGAIGPRGWLPRLFRATLAETRLPNNDVTLWDQSHVAGALFKSAAAGALLSGQAFNWKGDLKQHTHWRLLTIGIGAEHYEQRAVRVGDWLGARLQLDAFFQRVRKLVEVEFPLGSEIYHDGQVAVFTFPGRHQDSEGGEDNGVTAEQAEAIRDHIGERVDAIARDRALETPPCCRISDSSRSLVGLAAEVRQARQRLAVPLHRAWPLNGDQGRDPSSATGHTCPVCGVRPNGSTGQARAQKGQPCRVCQERRAGRLRNWKEGHYGKDTIWFSEIADGNDRLALLSLGFDLTPWLGGEAMDSLRAQAAEEWVRHNPAVQRHGIRPGHAFPDLVEYVRARIQQNPDQHDPVLRLLQDGFRQEAANSWRPFFSKIVEDRAPGAEAPRWEALTPEGRARWLVHQLLRKHPSPGRVHRFWRTTEAFLDDLLERFRELAARSPNRWRVRRLSISARIEEGPPLGEQDQGEVLNGHLGGQPLALLYRHDHDDLITVSNLARNLAETDTRTALEGQALLARGDEDDQPRKLIIERVREEGDRLGVYTPITPLDRSPERLRVLVPLAHAPDCLDTAISAWKEQFARVWDRMPLYAGAIAFPRLMPYQAVIEATRNLEDDLRGSPGMRSSDEAETWRVKGAELRDGIQSLHMTNPQGDDETVTVPLTLPDGRPDRFFPYCRVEDDSLRTPHDFAHPDGTVYRHMGDLQRGDGVQVQPARLAWLFMDSAGRRFESITPRPLADWRRLRRLWTLICRTAPSLAAVRGGWATLDEAWLAWRGDPEADAEWRELVRTVLHQRWRAEGAALEELTETAMTGELRRCLEWHLGVMKSPLEERLDDGS